MFTSRSGKYPSTKSIGDLNGDSPYAAGTAVNKKHFAAFETSTFKDKALYNASVSYMNAGKVSEAIRVRERFIKQFPNSPYTPTASRGPNM